MRWKHEEVEEAMEQLEDMERLREEKEVVDRELTRLQEETGGGGWGEGGRVEDSFEVSISFMFSISLATWDLEKFWFVNNKKLESTKYPCCWLYANYIIKQFGVQNIFCVI